MPNSPATSGSRGTGGCLATTAFQSNLDPDKVVLHYLGGGIGQTMCAILAPEAKLEELNETLDDAIQLILQEPTDGKPGAAAW